MWSASAHGQESVRQGARLVQRGNEALAEGRLSDALALYDEARALLPDAPEIAYDRGIALYRMGEFEKAQAAFQDAMKPGRPELEAAAKFNLGRCAHEAALQKKDRPAEALQDLTRAISYYLDAAKLNPRDQDPDHNRALAEKLKAYLEKQIEQQRQEQQSPSSQPTSQPEDQPTSQPNQQPSSQPSSQPRDNGDESEDKNGQPQQAGQEGQEERDERQQQGKEQKQEQSEKQGQQRGSGRTGEQRDESSESQAARADPESSDRQDEAKEQGVEPMLQEARDMERQRREARRAQMMRIRGRVPVEKDW